MCLWAIVPVKPLRRGKSRLASVLSQSEREQLNYDLLERTLKSLAQVPEIEKVLVVSRDPAALALARENHARTLMEDSNSELNPVLQRATMVARAYSACGVLILPADLPLISPEAVQEFIRQGGNPPEVVLAPDRKGTGLNGLLVSPASLIHYSFGPGALQRHILQAHKVNAHVKICSIPALELDLDLPEDLEYLKQLQAGLIGLEKSPSKALSLMEAK